MGAGGLLDPVIDAYLAAVAAGLGNVLGPALVGVYLHGSAVMGGWSRERSDVDVLAVTGRPLDPREKQVVAARLQHPSLSGPGAGLELSLVTAAVAVDPPWLPPFELHVATGREIKVTDGAREPGDADLILSFALCRRSGHAVAGPPPAEVFAEPPRPWLLERSAEELRWALRHPTSFAYRVLTACRAWRLLEEDVLDSKVGAGEWARPLVADPAVIDAALAAQRDLAPMPTSPADLRRADRFVAAVLDRFGPAPGP
jgi:aminoglycoside adenylyltransferase-like protein